MGLDSGKEYVAFVANKVIGVLPSNISILFLSLHQCFKFCHKGTAGLVMVSLQARVGRKSGLTSPQKKTTR
jgi:hypothetical protein